MNRAVFLDRDGVITQEPPHYAYRLSHLELIAKSADAIRLLNENGFMVIIASNQAGIAYGYYQEEDAILFNQAMKEHLAKEGAYIDDIYYCPHGWDEECECRKPKPGMFFQAAREHYIDLTKTIFIGDDERDLQAGDAAGCKTILVTPEKNLLKIVKSLTNKVLKQCT